MGKKERGRRRWEGDRKETGGRRQEEREGKETERRREEGGGKKENGRTGEEGEGKKEKGLTSKNLLSSSAVCALPALCNLIYRELLALGFVDGERKLPDDTWLLERVETCRPLWIWRITLNLLVHSSVL
ncbi:hypothetical protein NE237_016683 [Protea cynaroides]|uniref:Uncharacterized protein n=1 Tax=Protea cynaroides TaxID=273540 RepID=A0A9Q0K5Q9_9MAGN|nr:hypothetical protein NE237_016683 [Protea cynaroides]